jgi:hypothetical protein
VIALVHNKTTTYLAPSPSQRIFTCLSTLARLNHEILNTLSHTTETHAFGSDDQTMQISPQAIGLRKNYPILGCYDRCSPRHCRNFVPLQVWVPPPELACTQGLSCEPFARSCSTNPLPLETITKDKYDRQSEQPTSPLSLTKHYSQPQTKLKQP